MPEADYALGVDVGTTFTAAAVHRAGRTEIATLGNTVPPIPSLVFLREDGEILVGEAAERRGLAEPHRLAREFKRRLGDDTPIMLGGSPYSAEQLIAAVLREVVPAVAEREGADPATIAVSHPANWGGFKTDLLRQACDLADLDDVKLVSEPVAAAVHYSSTERVEPGAVVAVYDLGGGTFDAAVLRKSDDGFTTLGEPEGIERLGGIDFDAAVFAHVRQALGGAIDELDGNDPAVRTALARLRQECVSAKEALSFDTDATVPVLLPNVQTQLRLTRAEFEAMIRPPLAETIKALRRALAGARVAAGELTAVLLVGGSSRIPLVAEMVATELGRPVAVDVHPKHGVALGAALVAAGRVDGPAESSSPPPTVVLPVDATRVEEQVTAEEPVAAPDDESPRSRKRLAVLAGALLLVALLAAAAVALTGGGGGEEEPSTEEATQTGDTEPSPCGSESGRCVTITEITVEDGSYVVRYEVANFDPVAGGDHHLHFFFNTTEPQNAGTNGDPPGRWIVWDRASGDGELVFDGYKVADRRTATQMCVAVADQSHAVEADTANCVDLPASTAATSPSGARRTAPVPRQPANTAATTAGNTTTTTTRGGGSSFTIPSPMPTPAPSPPASDRGPEIG